MVLKPSQGEQTSPAAFQSPTMKQTSATCTLHFYYNMYGEGTSTTCQCMCIAYTVNYMLLFPSHVSIFNCIHCCRHSRLECGAKGGSTGHNIVVALWHPRRFVASWWSNDWPNASGLHHLVWSLQGLHQAWTPRHRWHRFHQLLPAW